MKKNEGLSVDIDAKKLLENKEHHGDFHLSKEVDVDKYLPKTDKPKTEHKPEPQGRKNAMKWVF